MSLKFGGENPGLTQAIRKLVAGGASSSRVKFLTHARDAMEKRGFDDLDVLQCLRRGTVYGPEIQGGQLRANVVNRGLKIRVAIGGLDGVDEDWTRLRAIVVVTVMGSD